LLVTTVTANGTHEERRSRLVTFALGDWCFSPERSRLAQAKEMESPVRRDSKSRNPVIFAESKRGRWRARGAYFLYASTLDAGIAKLSAKSTGFLGVLCRRGGVRGAQLF
jgi:hypothetical protein